MFNLNIGIHTKHSFARRLHQLINSFRTWIKCLGNRWIGRRGPQAWPPRSQDLKHLRCIMGRTVVIRDNENIISKTAWAVFQRGPHLYSNNRVRNFDYQAAND